MRLSPDIRDLLENSGVPWRVVEGRKHYKVIVNGRFCAILPKGPPARHASFAGRAQQNMISQIRRAIRGQR